MKKKNQCHTARKSCVSCSHCCRYVAFEIDKPVSLKDFDHILWYVLHQDVWVYVDNEDDWYVQFNARCSKLKNQKCSIYAERPRICRSYDPVDCTYHGSEPAEKYAFRCERDLFSFLKKKRPALYGKLKRSLKKPVKR